MTSPDATRPGTAVGSTRAIAEWSSYGRLLLVGGLAGGVVGVLWTLAIGGAELVGLGFLAGGLAGLVAQAVVCVAVGRRWRRGAAQDRRLLLGVAAVAAGLVTAGLAQWLVSGGVLLAAAAAVVAVVVALVVGRLLLPWCLAPLAAPGLS